MSMLDKLVEFKIDTGAGVTAITEATYLELKQPKLHQAHKKLCGPAQQRLQVLGIFQADLEGRQRVAKMDIYVIRGLTNNLLGLPGIKSLHLLEKLCEVNDESIMDQYSKVFTGLGNVGNEYVIKLRENVTPYALHAPRNIPIPLREKVQKELENMEQMGIIRKISEPTLWCAGMVVVPKKSGDIRICVDLQPLNENVVREIHPIPSVDEILAQLAGAKLFSKLDANSSGFWQIPLAKESQPLTTFITPFGRYCFNKLPFGICSAPEVYQKNMSQILEGLPGVLCLIDDILIFGQDKTEHNQRLHDTLTHLQQANVTLNPKKCRFNQQSLKFLGHIVDSQRIRADPEKTTAIENMEMPKSVTDLRRFMGMVNQLGKFSPNIADLAQPLRVCLSTKNAWTWGPAQDKAFLEVKQELACTPILALYDPRLKTKIMSDASSFGLGAVLMQEHQEEWRPVAYVSRAMSDTERHYAQIEKEALAITWACEKFRTYLMGLTLLVETDHKPLVPLFQRNTWTHYRLA